MIRSIRRFPWARVAMAGSVCWALAMGPGVPFPSAAGASARTSGHAIDDDEDDDGELARKHDLLRSPDWQRAVGELGAWLAVQSIYPPAEVRRIKARLNGRVSAMSSSELEYLLDSMSAKLRLLETPEAVDAKVWLGEYLSAMSDSRRARALGAMPDILDMSSADLLRAIQRVDSLRASMQERQQGVESRQSALADRAAAGRESTAAASRAATARARSAPSHSPYRSGNGSPPFSDYQPRRLQIVVGGMF